MKRKLENNICPICLETIQTSETRSVLSCSHQYHDICIHSWLYDNKNCPVCRTTHTGCTRGPLKEQSKETIYHILEMQRSEQIEKKKQIRILEDRIIALEMQCTLFACLINNVMHG